MDAVEEKEDVPEGDEDDVSKDKLIKATKPKGKTKATGTTAAKGKGKNKAKD